jgi:hypothetical protein
VLPIYITSAEFVIGPVEPIARATVGRPKGGSPMRRISSLDSDDLIIGAAIAFCLAIVVLAVLVTTMCMLTVSLQSGGAPRDGLGYQSGEEFYFAVDCP